jgi:uncharacterized protein (DUF1778 family)
MIRCKPWKGNDLEGKWHVTRKIDVVRLSIEDQQRFAEALFSAPAPSQALERAFAHRARLLQPE